MDWNTIGEKVDVDQLKDGINEICITMGRILFKRHYNTKDNRYEWKIWRLEDDLTATLVDYGFKHDHMRKLAKDLIERIL